MAERPSHRERPREDPSSEPTPDHLEQRQRLDGTLEDPGTVGDAGDEPPSPDQIEQRQRPDGSFERGAVDDGSEEALSADVIEQRQVVEDDDLDDDRRSE